MYSQVKNIPEEKKVMHSKTGLIVLVADNFIKFQLTHMNPIR